MSDCRLFIYCVLFHARIQLRKLVEAGVSQDELRQILSQLRSLTRAPQAPPQASSAPPPSSSYPPSTSTYPYSQQPTYARQFQPTYPTVSLPQPTGTFNYSSESTKVEPMNLSALLSSAQTNSQPSTAPAIPSSSITNLYNALLKAGVVSADCTPVGAGPSNDEERTPPPSNSLSRDNTRAYRKAILSEKIKLTTTDIVKYVAHCTLDFIVQIGVTFQETALCCVISLRSTPRSM